VDTSSYHADHGDDIHDIAVVCDDGQVGPTCDFNWSEIDGYDEPAEDTQYDIGDVSGALSVIVGWCCRPIHPNLVASRVLALQRWLWPAESRYDSMSPIAADCQCTKAAISKALLNLHDELGMRLPVGKNYHTRARFSEVQKRLVKTGRHASNRKRKAKRG
jgi:hypothetical protein